MTDRGIETVANASEARRETRRRNLGSLGALVRRRPPTPEVVRGRSFASDPFDAMRQMAGELSRMMDELWTDPGSFAGRGYWGMSEAWLPEIEVRRTPDALVITADLPGIRREDIDIELMDGALRIAGERSMEHEDEQEGVVRSERRYGRFERVIPLPDGVDADKVTARFADGVLEVKVPVPEGTVTTRKIAVR